MAYLLNVNNSLIKILKKISNKMPSSGNYII